MPKLLPNSPLGTTGDQPLGPLSAPSLSLLELQQLKQEFLSTTPFVDFEYVSLSFGAANTDRDIRTRLRPASPENIHYWLVASDRSTTLYHDQSGTRKAWGKGYILLRSSAASAAVTLLLFIPRT